MHFWNANTSLFVRSGYDESISDEGPYQLNEYKSPLWPNTQTFGWFLLDVRFQKSYNLTPYLVFPAGTEIRRVIGLCIEWSGSASPAHISLEISTLLAPSNSPIDRLKIAQLHTVFLF